MRCSGWESCSACNWKAWSSVLLSTWALGREGHTEGPLFPSRSHFGGSGSWDRDMSGDSGRRAIRFALEGVCGCPRAYTKLVECHSLRVGASNFCRWLGISNEVHCLLGGWEFLTSSTS